MKSFALLSLLIILELVDFSSNQMCRSLPFWQRVDGFSTCGGHEYLKGFYRDANQGKEEEIDLLRKASCCTAPPPDEYSPQICTYLDFWDALNMYVN